MSPPLRASATWTYALVGGIASIPFTVGRCWLSGAGSRFSLNAVSFGGLLAGSLASAVATETDGSGVGFRAGVVDGPPGVWLLVDVLGAATVLPGPLYGSNRSALRRPDPDVTPVQVVRERRDRQHQQYREGGPGEVGEPGESPDRAR